MEKTILRILAGTKLSPLLEQKLDELLPDHRKVFFTKNNDYKGHIQQRINSLYDAFLFLVAAYPPRISHSYVSIDTANTWIAEEKNIALVRCNDRTTSFEQSREELKTFTRQLLIFIQFIWDTRSSEEAIKYLNNAEQYMLMGKGRSDTVTLLPMRFGEHQDYILQWEETLPSFYDEWLGELQLIVGKEFPITPLWFKTLKPEAQNYLCGMKSMLEKEDALVTLDGLIADLAQIEVHTSLWRVENKKLLQQIIEFIVSTSETTLVAMNYFKQFLTQRIMEPSFSAELITVLQLPSWYLFLSESQQYFLKHVISHAETLEAAVSFLSSRHRSLPAPANFASHCLIRLCADGSVLPLSDKRFRSSHVASRDVLKLPLVVQTRHSDFNLKEVLRYAQPEQEILFQTLISPLDKISNLVPSQISNLLPDSQLNEEADKAIKRSTLTERIAKTNHPYNIAKMVLSTPADNSGSMVLITRTVSYLSRLSNNIDEHQRLLSSAADSFDALLDKINKLVVQKLDLQQLLDDYEALLNSPIGSATWRDVNGRELFLSSLEQLIMLRQEGYCYGSCVSGKDRKAIELMHTDACLIYKIRYNVWPKYTDMAELRANFSNIVATLYLSRHHQVLAGQNAPGATGIKTPYDYLPDDICKMIQSRSKEDNILENENKLATYNEVKDILPSSMHSFFSYANPPKPALNKLSIALLTREMGDTLCTKLYDALYALINEIHLFEINPQGKMIFSNDLLPAGIKEIRTTMHKTKKDFQENSMSRLEDIINIVASRPHKQSNRNIATNLVYNNLLALLQPKLTTEKKENQLVLQVNAIIEEWSTLFEESKNENAIRNEMSEEKNMLIANEFSVF